MRNRITIPGFRALILFWGATLVVLLGGCKQVPTTPCVVTTHTGSIRVDSNPTGAAVWLDEVSKGKVTPALLSDLAPGTHKLTLKKSQDCFQDEERVLVVPEDDTIDIFADLRPAVPVLLEPAPNAVLDNGRTDGKDKIVWDFKWQEVKGATAYQLYVRGQGATAPRISKLVYVSAYHDESGGYIDNANRFNWYWYVCAYIGGRWCSWSAGRIFQVEPVNTDPPSF